MTFIKKKFYLNINKKNNHYLFFNNKFRLAVFIFIKISIFFWYQIHYKPCKLLHRKHYESPKNNYTIFSK